MVWPQWQCSAGPARPTGGLPNRLQDITLLSLRFAVEAGKFKFLTLYPSFGREEGVQIGATRTHPRIFERKAWEIAQASRPANQQRQREKLFGRRRRGRRRKEEEISNDVPLIALSSQTNVS